MNRQLNRQQRRSHQRRRDPAVSGVFELPTGRSEREQQYVRYMQALLEHADTIARYPLQGMLDMLAESEAIWSSEAATPDALAMPERFQDLDQGLAKLRDQREILRSMLTVRETLLTIKRRQQPPADQTTHSSNDTPNQGGSDGI